MKINFRIKLNFKISAAIKIGVWIGVWGIRSGINYYYYYYYYYLNFENRKLPLVARFMKKSKKVNITPLIRIVV